MTPEDAAAFTAAAVRAYLAAAGMYFAAVQDQSPGLSVAEILKRTDVRASIAQAFEEAEAYVRQAVTQAWEESGADSTRVLRELLRDVDHTYARMPRLVSRLHGTSRPPREVFEDYGRGLALLNTLTVDHAVRAGRTQALLEQAARDDLFKIARKQWVAHVEKPTCCHWCRNLHGRTIPLHDDFAPYIGGPADLTGHGRFTQPPKPYRGVLPGPPLHPNCECDLLIVSGGIGDGISSHEAREGLTALPFLASSDIRAMSAPKYRLLIEYLRAAAHELGLVLRRLYDELH